MKLSIIWMVKPSEKTNQKTWDCLVKECQAFSGAVQILAYRAPDSWKKKYKEFPGEKTSLEYVVGFGKASNVECYQDAAGRVTGDFVTQLEAGDTWSEGMLKEIAAQQKIFPGQSILMPEKIMPDGEKGYFATDGTKRAAVAFYLNRKFSCYPFYFGGTFIRRELLQNYEFHPEYGLDAERKFFLDICAEKNSVLYIRTKKYYSHESREGDGVFFPGIYQKPYYQESLREFWPRCLQEWEEKYGQVPLFIQYHLLFSVNFRLEANWNNKNKHVLDEEEARACLADMGSLFRKLDEKVVFNAHRVEPCIVSDSQKWVYGILRNGEDFHFGLHYLGGKSFYCTGDISFNAMENLKTNIQFMDYRNGRLEIDGTVHTILFDMADEVYFTYGGDKIPIVYNGRYGLTKAMGVSIYKVHGFHLSIPIRKKPDAFLFCYAEIGEERVKIKLSFESHTSRMSDRFQNSYWWFGSDEEPYCMTAGEEGLHVRRTEKKQHRKQERKLWKEMFSVGIRGDKRALLFILIRLAFFVMKPIYKRRPIWMYLDKIYKAGDSAEYLFRYAKAQKDGIAHYYLVDKNTPDYKRLKREGFHPLVRGSIKHRLIFLMADMMVISNSTVFTFNNFGMINSSYVRDLPDFHVCCVQHGMSVQKIAVAQTRLRDNTRLYFCASKYELRNLIHPEYDYLGYDALKLTGVPRYDGLKNDDKKQIMISPTWRMQAAVPVRGSEGMQRDYNPRFKQTSYFKVFNALINDERLIAAAKEYGYRIKYVLHPIVSAQVKDFTKNDYVDIIPAAGDMSYEKMFRESSLMVTDFSGIQFDFAYMRKPLVYLHHKDIPQHYEEGSFFYDTMAFGEICHDNDELIDILVEYMKNGCHMKPEYVARADDFFYYNDHSNCERIYKVMRDYQEKYILHPYELHPTVLQGEFDLSVREAQLEKTDALLQAKKAEVFPKTTTDFYFDKDIREKTVMLLGLGHNVRGSMQYILNELNRNSWYSDFTVYVRAFPDTEETIRNYIEKNHWERTRVVSNDLEYAQLLESVKYLITETFFPQSWIKKPEQVYVNIWHGTPLKKLGLAKNSKNIHKDGNTQRNFIEANYLMYPNDYTRKHMLASYKVADLTTGKAAMVGYPRTGGLMAAAGRDQTELKQRLAPNGETLYAYMPTWKAHLKEAQVVAETKELLDYLDSVLRDDQILYSNLHHKVNDVIDYSEFKHIKRFPMDIDTYELLAATEALITDYSSVFFDYLATRKQIILYCGDYDLYQQKRGTYMNLWDLPFDKAVTKEEVAEALNRGKQYDDTQAFEEFCKYDSIYNAQAVCSLLLGEHYSDAVSVEDIERSQAPKVLVYSDRFEPSAATDAIRVLTENTDPAERELYLSCEMDEVDANKKSAYPMMSLVPVIGTHREQHISSRGKALRELYQEQKISFAEMMDYLQYDFALAAYRMYGRAHFDEVIMADIEDPERIMTLAIMQSGPKSLFITEEMLQRVKDGDFAMRDAVCYAAERGAALYAYNKKTAEEASAAVPEWKTIRCVEEGGLTACLTR